MKPAYPRQALTSGIVHFGVGGFHRAHHAMFVDRLLERGEATTWAITGAGVTPADVKMRDALAKQDHLYTLVLKHADGRRDARVIGSIVDFVYGPDDPERLVERLAAAETRIVSLTITEGGYGVDSVPEAIPTTVFGYVAEALRRRRDRGLPAFTVMSCDNIEANGEVARQSFTSFARLADPALADWMDDHVRFPSSMVDRITPVTTPDDIAMVEHDFGIVDAWPVVAEPFVQWVLEDDFADGRPPYDEVGVQLVEDVAPYELMKLRLLNGSHQGLAYFGALAGHRFVHDAAQDPQIVRLLRRYMEEEATPTLRPVPGIDLGSYRDDVIARFANAHIRDTIARVAQDTSDRIPKFVLPVVAEQLAADRPVTVSAAIVASWAHYARGVADDGSRIEVVDRLAPQVTAAASQRDPLAFLEQRALFGDLVEDARFVEPFLRTLESLSARGSRETLRDLAQSG